PDSVVFEAHSGSMQRKNGRIWTASPTGAADQPQVRQTASLDQPRYSRCLRFQEPGKNTRLEILDPARLRWRN
ncbi:hypothetical protein V6O07_16090, partial [Arthrospira platensis SPKY2]